jgi:hydroxymethylpyrimidine pyrophosphatase-like HAD family hydrolase
VVAFGDSMNDYDVLSWVGRGYGVAPLAPALTAVVDGVVAEPGGTALAGAIDAVVG